MLFGVKNHETWSLLGTRTCAQSRSADNGSHASSLTANCEESNKIHFNTKQMLLKFLQKFFIFD